MSSDNTAVGAFTNKPGHANMVLMKKPRSATRTRAIAYCRVSTEKQAETGISLEAQQSKLTAYASLYDLDLLEVIVDAGVSAKSLDRPGLTRALGMLRRGDADALVVVKLDRLTRSVRDLGELVDGYFADGKIALLSLGEQIDTRSAGGRLVLNVLASVSQWEREAVGERTSAALAHKAAKGGQIGHDAPYGWAYRGGQLVARVAEAEVIATAKAMRAEGLSIRAVAKALAAKGFTSRSGGGFAPIQVQRMLAGPKRLRVAA